MIRNVIFDIGNVLITYDWESYLDGFGYDPEVRERVANAVFLSDTWNDRDQGGKEEEVYRAEFVSHDPELKKEILEVMERCTETCKEFDYAAEWIRAIKAQGYRVYLLSNYSKYMFEMQREQFAFYPLVDGHVISYQYCMRKPFPGIYQALLDKYRLNPEECLFLDDLQANLDAARKFGIHTIQVTGHEAAVEGLKQYDIKSVLADG